MTAATRSGDDALIQVQNLKMHFPVTKGIILKRTVGAVKAVDGLNFSIRKGETLIDTALTLNAMRPDILVVRHPNSGAVDLLAKPVDAAVISGLLSRFARGQRG